MKRSKKALAADRTVDMFTGKTNLEQKEEAIAQATDADIAVGTPKEFVTESVGIRFAKAKSGHYWLGVVRKFGITKIRFTPKEAADLRAQVNSEMYLEV